MDSLDDPFAEPVVAKAPTTGRFQPKIKPRPKKGPSVAVKATKAPSVASVPKDLVLNQSNLTLEKNLEAPNSSSLTDNESSRLLAEAKEVAGSAITGDSEIAGLTTTVADAPDIHNEDELSDFHSVSSASGSFLRPCNAKAAPDQHVDQTFEDQEGYKESIDCGDGDFQIDVEQLEAGDFSCLDTIDITTEGDAASEKRAVKFKPKPKAQSDRRKKDPAEAVSHLPHVQNLPLESEHMMRDDSIHGGELNTVSDVVHTRLDGDFSLDPSLYQPDTVVSEDTDSLMPEKLQQQSGEEHRERNSYDALGSSAKSVDEGFLTPFEGNEDGYKLQGEINCGFNNNNSSYDRAPDNSALNGDENNDGDHIHEETLQKKRPRKSKKVTAENNKKPPRKRKKATQELNESVEKPPKKFPRATRRKRCVDKSLLEAPEDELDLQRVPIRDLIIFAEYKERQAKKEAATAMPPPTTERNDNPSPEDLPYDDNESFGFDQDGDTYDNPPNLEVQKDTGYYNYQSYMTKETRARWNKQDTELFFQALSQFGSDLSMIQQLFPGRTRHQIKLKYKKEERQNPMRLNDALTSRTQDLSHFEFVIKRLQEQAAQEEKIENDDSVCVLDEDEGQEEVLNTHENVANAKHNEEARVVDQESPKLSYSEEEEYDDWSTYNGL